MPLHLSEGWEDLFSPPVPSSTCDPPTDAPSGESHFSIVVFFKQAFMLLIVAAHIKAE